MFRIKYRDMLIDLCNTYFNAECINLCRVWGMIFAKKSEKLYSYIF